MSTTWSHPRLGELRFKGDVWTVKVAAPGFDRFRYDTGYSNAGPPTGTYDLTFCANGSSDPPSAAATELAVRILDHQDELVTAVTRALWEDFNGRGPGSGMWWHGDLATVQKSVDWEGDGHRISGPDDLLPTMRLFNILIEQRGDEESEPVAQLCSWSSWEEEHNVGLLTDGSAILGLGYHLDVEPFGWDQEVEYPGVE